MEKLALFLFAFTFCFIGRLTLYLISKMPRRKKKKKETKNGIAIEIKYLSNKFDLPLKRIDTKAIASIISMLDALIIAGTLYLVVNITDSITLELCLGLIIVIALIYLTYEILGRILIWKGMKK
ncbi:MAG TPA: hypothetical protein DCY94_02175 [Firmicutes bacterium]|nr:hypothetical protein [Bacillota bacterium]